MRYEDVRQKPTEVHAKTNQKIHESVFRSYHILAKVKDLLAQKTPADVVLDLIADMQNAPFVTLDPTKPT